MRAGKGGCSAHHDRSRGTSAAVGVLLRPLCCRPTAVAVQGLLVHPAGPCYVTCSPHTQHEQHSTAQTHTQRHTQRQHTQHEQHSRAHTHIQGDGTHTHTQDSIQHSTAHTQAHSTTHRHMQGKPSRRPSLHSAVPPAVSLTRRTSTWRACVCLVINLLNFGHPPNSGGSAGISAHRTPICHRALPQPCSFPLVLSGACETAHSEHVLPPEQRENAGSFGTSGVVDCATTELCGFCPFAGVVSAQRAVPLPRRTWLPRSSVTLNHFAIPSEIRVRRRSPRRAEPNHSPSSTGTTGRHHRRPW